MKKDEIFIFRKFQEKITPQDTEEQKKIKANLNLMKLKGQTEILKDKTTPYKTKYQEIEQELITEFRLIFKNKKDTDNSLVKEQSENKCKKEEEKPRKILNKKITWLKNLPQKKKKNEKEKEKNTNEKKMKNANKRTTNQKHNTLTENIIPPHKQHIKEKLTYQNTRYIQTDKNIQKQATPQKKDTN